jgi:hypothetical protein
VNAVIESVTAIANGAVGGAAKAIENAMSKALPVIIGFMASLLGLGGITGKIQDIIKRVRQPIEKAIDWVISQAVKFAKKIGNKLGFGKGKKGNKEGEEGKITAADREKHQKIAVVIKKDLTEQPKKPQRSFEDFYKSKTQQAKQLERKYQPQLKRGIGLNITFGSLDKDKKDSDIDFKVRIAPNTTELEFPVDWESGDGIKEEFIKGLKQEYRDILSQDPNSEGIPKYQDLEKEIEILKEEEMKDVQKAKEHFEKIKKQVEAIREISKYRAKYKNLGEEITTDRVVIYGIYDLTLTHKEGGEPKRIEGKYNAVSSQTTTNLEEKFNEAQKNQEDDRMMPTQNQYMRFFKVNPGMVNKARAARLSSDSGNRFPNPTHDAETKLFEYIARQIINAVHGEQSPEEQDEEKEINESSKKLQENKTYVPALDLKEKLKSKLDMIKTVNKGLDESFKALQYFAQLLSLDEFTTVDATNYVNLQQTLLSRKEELRNIIMEENELRIGDRRLTKPDEKKMGVIFSSQIGNSLQKLEGLNREANDLAKSLESLQQQLKESTDKEVPWLNENNKDVGKLKQQASEFQQRQEKKLQHVIENWKISGKIIINDEQKACNSCSGIIKQFVEKLQPSGGEIEIDITEAVQYYYGKTEPR